MINYDHEDGVSVSSKLTSSILTVRNATARHGGKQQRSEAASIFALTQTFVLFRPSRQLHVRARQRQTVEHIRACAKRLVTRR